MSSLSTKKNKNRSTPSKPQSKAAAKSQIKKAAAPKVTKKPARKISARSGKGSTIVAAPAAPKKASAKRPAAKAVAAKITKKPVTPIKTQASAKKRTPAKVEAKAADLQPKRNSMLESRAAVEAFEKALKLFSRQEFAAAKSAFEQILTKFGNQSDVIIGVRKYLAVVEQRLARTPSPPKNPDALYDRGVFELNKANFQEAINLFEKSLKAQPEAAHVLYSLAAAYARINNIKKALEALRQATNLQTALRSRARSDLDFTNLYNNEDFRYLTGYGFDIQD